MKAASTGVVVLNYGTHEDTAGCLQALAHSVDLNFQLLVVDNGPEDERHKSLYEAVGERVEVIATGSNLGYAGGNNFGIQLLLERGCDTFWILNPDARPDRDALVRMRDHLDRVRDCGIVGPRLLTAAKQPRIASDGGVVDRSNGVTKHLSAGLLPAALPPPGAEDVDYVTGASLLVRRSMVEQVGMIPEQYFLYYEETDWCHRAQAAGWRTMVERRAVVTHFKRSSGLLPEPHYLYYMTRNRYLFAQSSLGIDGEVAIAALQTEFLAPWRARVERHAPSWVSAFDEIVGRALEDGRAGRTGRCDWITDYPNSEDARGRPEV